ncbi:acyltransferase [bacterium SCSIO 12696]|uniref:acyltransferase n=1 Tax=Porticoccus sp. W117 TaxID=3054777 RepID=UPI0022002AB9|nr:acyltransferase [Porticoccus sp. W117]MDM3872377.1 acyltransferase [Porticoccus sp. W117]UTW46022.1 acyltransferase [bacterium SCSIO 12696]
MPSGAKAALHSIAASLVMRVLSKWGVFLCSSVVRILGILKSRAYLKVGTESVIHYTTEIKYPENIEIKGVVTIGPGCTLGAKGGIELGDLVRFSKGVVVETASLDLNSGLPYKHVAQKTIINDGVWLGSNVIVLGGVTIGRNAVIGAGVVVSKDVPEGAIVVGGKNREIVRKGSY